MWLQSGSLRNATCLYSLKLWKWSIVENVGRGGRGRGTFLFSRDRWHRERRWTMLPLPTVHSGWRSDYSILSPNAMFFTLTNCISICHLSQPTFPDLMPSYSNRLRAACIDCSFLTPLPHSNQSSQTSLLNIVFVLRQLGLSKVITSWLLRWCRY